VLQAVLSVMAAQGWAATSAIWHCPELVHLGTGSAVQWLRPWCAWCLYLLLLAGAIEGVRAVCLRIMLAAAAGMTWHGLAAEV
jgi:hypothetical protein